MMTTDVHWCIARLADCCLLSLRLASPAFLQQYNPEMVWASKGFLFIRINPSFHLDEESLRLMNVDFELFRLRVRENTQ